MKKFGLPFWLCIGIVSIAICWWIYIGQFPFSGSWDVTCKIVFFFLVFAFAITAYERTQANTKTIDEVVSKLRL